MTMVVRISVDDLAKRLEEVIFRAYHGERFVVLEDDEPAALILRHPDAPSAIDTSSNPP